MTSPETFSIDLPGPEDTDRLGRWFAPRLVAGDVILLDGQIGAGKTHFARALIRAKLAEIGQDDDVPSPTFTLVQTYATSPVEIVHADLYRLTSPDEVHELGLVEAFQSAIALVEWPDRLGTDLPKGALSMTFRDIHDGGSRRVTFADRDGRWSGRLAELRSDWSAT